MTTARKPPQKPLPKITRPLRSNGKRPQPDPFTTEVMQRIRREIANSRGTLTIVQIAREIGTSPQQLSEWMAGFRASPGSEDFGKLIRIAARYDMTFVREVILAPTIKSIGIVPSIQTGRLTIEEIRTIKSHSNDVKTRKKDSLRFGVSMGIIRDIHSGKHWSSVQ